jgi:hypothetical protein
MKIKIRIEIDHGTHSMIEQQYLTEHQLKILQKMLDAFIKP